MPERKNKPWTSWQGGEDIPKFLFLESGGQKCGVVKFCRGPIVPSRLAYINFRRVTARRPKMTGATRTAPSVFHKLEHFRPAENLQEWFRKAGF